ncbi:MAG TPA: endonuclease domain-containing protein [Candidatus Kapabacteria bacterium]|nr:endonuclease domain-containing protein [Candidatus Kapabacteria bacterium]
MPEAFNNRSSLKEKRRALRREPTRAEAELWNGLRNNRCGGYKFRRQHSLGPFIVDFYCPEVHLAVEVDGVTHDDPDIEQYDRHREEYLIDNGIAVIRFTDGEVLWSVDLCIKKILERIVLITGKESTAPTPP